MAGAAVQGRLGDRLRWRAAELVERRAESATAVTLVFGVPDWPGHVAGQHIDLRLTAEDGYTAQRSYSIASAPNGERVELTVQRVAGGEVSPYLAEVLRPGDQVEVRGPVGGWFVWQPEQTEPVLLVAGGSGLVPLMCMIRVREAVGGRVPFRLLYSVRGPADLLYPACVWARSRACGSLPGVRADRPTSGPHPGRGLGRHAGHGGALDPP